MPVLWTSHLVEARIRGDAVEPGGEFRGWLVPGGRPVDLQKDVLGDLLRPLTVPHEVIREVHDGPPVSFEELAKCLLVPGPHSQHELHARIGRGIGERHVGLLQCSGTPVVARS